ncbi:MAG: ABC transporter permease [Austwickia sp.]|nr:ABC transporter permease [Austwickia sp.]MCO5307959.1 ABC transporter permease [Austwickia sp.]
MSSTTEHRHPDSSADRSPGRSAGSTGDPTVAAAERASRPGAGAVESPTRGIRAWPVVAVREIQVRITDKNFLVSTLMTMVIMLAIFAVQGFIIGKGAQWNVVTTTQSAQDLAGRIGTAAHAADDKNSVQVRRAADDEAARAQLRDGAADVYLHQRDGAWTLTTKNDTPPSALQAVAAQTVRAEALASNAQAAGTTLEALNQGTALRTDQLEGSGTEMIVRMITGLVLGVMFYMVSLMFGLAIAQSVVEEKQSRIVEIIASAIPLRQLLTGKVLGNTVLAFGQMVLFVAAGLIGLQFTPYKEFVTAVSGPVGWFVAFFVVGFIALACLWAVAGSLSSRQEDLSTTTQPMQLLLLVAFMGGTFAQGSVQQVLSFVPVVSGVAMPMRMLGGGVPLWQTLAALAITLVFAALAILLGEKVYRRSILAGGGRVSWRQAMRSAD